MAAESEGASACIRAFLVLGLLAFAGALLPAFVAVAPADVPNAPNASPERTWNVTFPGSPDELAISDDGKTVVIASIANETYVMATDQQRPIRHHTYTAGVTTVAIAGDASRMAASLRDPSELLVYQVNGSEPLWRRPLEGHSYMVALSPSGDRVVLGDNGTVFLLDGANGKELQNWSVPLAGELSTGPPARFSADGSSVILRLRTSVVRLDIGKAAPRWTFQPPPEGNQSWPELRDLAVSADLSGVAVTGFSPRLLWFLDGTDGRVLWNRSFGNNAWLTGASLDASGKRLAVLTNEGRLYRLDTDANTVRSSVTVAPADDSFMPIMGETAMDSAGSLVAVAVNIQGGKFAGLGPTSAVYLYQWDSQRPAWRYLYHAISPRVVFARDGSHLVITDRGVAHVMGKEGDVLPANTVATAPPLIPVMTATGAVTVLVIFAAFGATEPGRLAIHAPLVGLYTRLRHEDVVDQQVRSRILAHVTANPGVHYSAIRDALGLANGNAAYHLKVLCREGQLRPRRHGLRVHFYIPRSDAIRAALPDGTVDEIVLTLLQRSPGATQTELAGWAGFDQSTISRALHRLMDAGTVQQTAKDQVHYYWPGRTLTGGQ